MKEPWIWSRTIDWSVYQWVKIVADEHPRLRENETAYDRYKIRPRILVNVDQVDTSTEILGTKVAFPLGFSPAASQKLAHPEGEVGASRAAAKYGICMGLSSYSNYSLEEVASQGLGNPYAIQMCVLKDRSLTEQLLKRAESMVYIWGLWAGYSNCISRGRIQGSIPIRWRPSAWKAS